MRSIEAGCECGRRAVVDVSTVPGATEVPALRHRLRVCNAAIAPTTSGRTGWSIARREWGGSVAQCETFANRYWVLICRLIFWLRLFGVRLCVTSRCSRTALGPGGRRGRSSRSGARHGHGLTGSSFSRVVIGSIFRIHRGCGRRLCSCRSLRLRQRWRRKRLPAGLGIRRQPHSIWPHLLNNVLALSAQPTERRPDTTRPNF